MTTPKKSQPSSPIISLGSLGTSRDYQDGPSANTGTANGAETGAAGSDSDSEDGSKSTPDTWDDEERFVPVLGSATINTSGPGAACEYPGFVLLGPDLYARSHNPQMLMNEAGVRSFLRHLA